MTGVDDIIKRIVLAHADNELKAIVVAFINHKGELELELSFAHNQAFAINTGLDLLKVDLLAKIRRTGLTDPTDRI